MIGIKNLSKTYGAQPVLNNANFTFPPSGLVCLLGASGCGKSTLINLIAGFDQDYSGEILVDGTNINTLSPSDLCAYRKSCIGFVFQNYNLLTGYTALENVLLPCQGSLTPDLNTKTALDLLKKLGIFQKRNQQVQTLSGGQKQRVAIARALMREPRIILADEPTGALDRKNATEIMKLLKEIAKDHLVLVITHDPKICEFATQTVCIQEGQLVGKTSQALPQSPLTLTKTKPAKGTAFRLALKNFKVHCARYIAVSLAISVGILAFVLSMSSKNLMSQSIADFKQKNTAFNNGYIKIQDNLNQVVSTLKDDARISLFYQQYVIQNVALTLGDFTVTMAEKYPMPKATQAMSYGVMPKVGQNQISLSPSLAKKFENDISKLVGKEVILNFGETQYHLTVSGIFNAGFDDFFVSADIEQALFQSITEDTPYSVSFDVATFDQIVPVHQSLEEKGIQAQTASKEVSALQSTFQTLSRLFFAISILILAIGLFISGILLIKLQNSRCAEIGLLSALGFEKNLIRGMIVNETLLLCAVAAVINALLSGGVIALGKIFAWELHLTLAGIGLSILGTGLCVVCIAIFASHRLIHTQPAAALRK